MLRHFGTEPTFWDELPRRAQALGLTEQLALACHFCMRWLGTPVPEPTAQAIVASGPSTMRRAWLLPLLARILTPTEPDDKPARAQDIAATVLLARYHYHRMPLRLLVPHLWHKMRSRRDAGSDGDF